MKSPLILILPHVFTMAGLSGAATPPRPGLKYLYTGNVTVADGIDIGLGPWGTRVVYAVAGGVFAGPELKGTIVPVGGDWTLRGANGTITADVRQTIETDDGARIQVFETGSSQLDGTLHLRLTYETGSEKYLWLNSVVGVGILRILSSSELSFDVWQLVAPSDTPSA